MMRAVAYSAASVLVACIIARSYRRSGDRFPLAERSTRLAAGAVSSLPRFNR